MRYVMVYTLAVDGLSASLLRDEVGRVKCWSAKECSDYLDVAPATICRRLKTGKVVKRCIVVDFSKLTPNTITGDFEDTPPRYVIYDVDGNIRNSSRIGLSGTAVCIALAITPNDFVNYPNKLHRGNYVKTVDLGKIPKTLKEYEARYGNL